MFWIGQWQVTGLSRDQSAFSWVGASSPVTSPLYAGSHHTSQSGASHSHLRKKGLYLCIRVPDHQGKCLGGAPNIHDAAVWWRDGGTLEIQWESAASVAVRTGSCQFSVMSPTTTSQTPTCSYHKSFSESHIRLSEVIIHTSISRTLSPVRAAGKSRHSEAKLQSALHCPWMRFLLLAIEVLYNCTTGK